MPDPVTRRPQLPRAAVPAAFAAVALIVSAGLAPAHPVAPANAGILISTTTTAQVHTASHAQDPEVPLGTTLHMYVKVSTASRLTPGGTVEVRRFSGAGCNGTLQQTSTAKLDRGNVDVLASAYKATKPGWVYFNARYLGSALYAPSATTGCYGVNVTATPTVTFVMHDAGHKVLSGPIPVGALVHPRVTVSGDWGTPVGAARARMYWDELFQEPCTGVYKEAEFVFLEGGKADLEASWTSSIVRKAWVQVLYSISGDGPNYSSEYSDCVAIAFKGLPNVTAEARTAGGDIATTVKVGAGVRLGATVTGSLGVVSGDVRFRLWNGTTCSGTPAVNRVSPIDLYGSASTQVTMAATGTKAYQATYLGNTLYLARKSACKTFKVSSPADTPSASPSAAPVATTEPTGSPVPSASPAPPSATAPAASVAPSQAATAQPSGASATADATPDGASAPAVNVGDRDDTGLLIVALFVFGIGLLAVGIVAGILISRRSRRVA